MAERLAAPTVSGMSSCRATSFYLAPGVQRYFKNHTLVAVLPDGTWVEISHRKDIARMRNLHPGWDGTVLCGGVGGVEALRHQLLDDPANVERWSLDERVVEGRRPDGVQHPLHRMQNAGVEAVGGVKQAISAILPGAPKSLRQAAETILRVYGNGAAHRLSLVCALRGIVPDDELARLLSAPSFLDAGGWAPVDVHNFRADFLTATAPYGARRRVLAAALVTGSGLSQTEREAVVRPGARLDPALQRELLEKNEDPFELGGLARVENLDADVARALYDKLSTADLELLLSNKTVPFDVVERFIEDRLQMRIEIQEQAASGNSTAYEPSLAWVAGGVRGNTRVEVALLTRLCGIGGEGMTEENYERLEQLGFGKLSVGAHRVAVPWLIEQAYKGLERGENVWDAPAFKALLRFVEDGEGDDLMRSVLKLAEDSGDKIWNQSLLRTAARSGVRGLELQAELLRNGTDDTLGALARNPHLDRELRGDMLHHSLFHVRESFAMRHDVTKEEARELADWRPERLLDVALYAPSLATLEVLSVHPDREVRMNVSRNRGTPTSILDTMREDPDDGVKREAMKRTAGWANRSEPREMDRAEPAGRLDAEETRDIHLSVELIDQGRRDIRHSVERDLAAAAVMVQRRSAMPSDQVVWPDQPRTLSDLPGYGDLPFSNIEAARAALDGSTFKVHTHDLLSDPERTSAESSPGAADGGEVRLVARVLDSKAAIERNAEYMGNCTAGYVHDVARGSTRLVGLYDEDGKCHLNVELTVSNDGSWRAGEINTRFNGYGFGYEQTPESVRQVADQLARTLQGSSPKI